MSGSLTRRSVLQSGGLVGLAGVVPGRAVAGAQGEGESFQSRFGEVRVLGAGLLEPGAVTGSVSPDGLATTILFGDRLDVRLDADVEAGSITRVAVLEIPVTIPDPKEERFLGYHASVPGTVVKGEGTRVVLSLDLGGSHHAVEYPFGEAYEGGINPDDFFAYARIQVKQVVGPDGERDVIEIPTPPHFTAILMVSIQRRTPDEVASVLIENLDVEIIRPRKDSGSPQDGGTEGRGPDGEPKPYIKN
ncbi:hypothetical protein [Tautonia plasticadhaerens]|nr:hypothetical protein [Tautonia plasticadhaerens]